jgi:DNA-binding NarL/FixJ family response regulator
MAQSTENFFGPLSLIWVDCPYPVASIGLARILESEARVHIGEGPPEGEDPSFIILCPGIEGVSEALDRVRRTSPQAMTVVFGLYLDLELARAALRNGARGFIHAGMSPTQIVRALEVAAEGELVAPRPLLEYLIATDEFADLDILSTRQREILDLVSEGLTNAQIGKRLFLTESTVKQHLRSAYKILGVSNRTEAVRLIRNDSEASVIPPQ